MSYKTGIPLLKSFDDGNDSDDDDFALETVVTSGGSRCRCSKRCLCFSGVLVFAIVTILGMVAAATVVGIIFSSSDSGGKSGAVQGTNESVVLSMPASSGGQRGSVVPPTATAGLPKTSELPRSVSMPESSAGLPKTSSLPRSVTMPESSAGLPKTSSLPRSVSMPESSAGLPKTSELPRSVSMPESSAGPLKTSELPPSLVHPSPTTSSSPVSMPESSAGLPKTSTLSPSPTTSHLMPTPTPTSIMAPPNCSTIESCKAKTDLRSYEVFALPNQLRVLAISDPKSNYSAASMDVAVGSFSDPRGVQGLAHFCEHMLFLGTERYPDEHEYSNYLQTHGGGDNAFTSTQETNYYFSVESAYLERALDMFAWFFIDPLFTPNATGREMNAVNSEHEKNLQSDGWRQWQLLKHVSNPDHPFSQFSTGTIETLNRSNISDYLNDYYNTFYSANQMQLVVYGQQSLSTLRQWVNQSFSAVPDQHTTTPGFAPLTSFPMGYTGKVVYYYPVADTNSVVIYWQTQPLQWKYRNSISGFITHFLGDESSGSVLDYLRQRNWADGLTASVEVNTDTYSLMYVYIEVTQIGLPHVSEIVQTVFQYVRLLSSLSEQQVFALWQDLLSTEQIKFDYAAKKKPSDYATELAQTMRVTEDPADFLGNPTRLIFNFSAISDVLSSLSPANSVLFLGSHMFNTTQANSTRLAAFMQESPVNLPWPELNKTEPIYGTYYKELPLSRELLMYWSMDVPHVELSLPAANQFVPKNLDILPLPSDVSKVPEEVEMEKGGVSLWWMRDSEFKEPRVNLYCDITTSNAVRSPRWTVLSALFTQQVTSILQPYLYPATRLGYSYSLTPLTTGLSLQFEGFSDPDVVRKVLQMVVNAMTNHTFLMDFSAFQLVMEGEKEALRNYNLTTLPYRYTIGYLQHVVMDRPFWKHWQLLEELNGVSLLTVLDHARNHLLTNATVLCFAEGNLGKEEAINYASIVAGAVASLTEEEVVGSYQRERVQLAPGNYSVTLQTLNPQDTNSVINVVFQGDAVCHQETSKESTVCSHDSLVTAVHFDLLDRVFGDQCFFQLRTTEQLGYVAYCYSTANSGIGSFQVLVQSAWADPQYLLDRIDLFLTNQREEIEGMTADNLTEIVKTYKSGLHHSDLSLREQAQRLWGYISTGNRQFDLGEQKITALGSVNITTLQDFYYSTVLNPMTYRKMIIGVHGADDDGEIGNVTYPLVYASLNQTRLHY